MKTKLPWILTVVLAIALVVVVFGRSNDAAPAKGASADPHAAHKAAEKKILYWVDPMHPAYK